jgi:hypothetical protein
MSWYAIVSLLCTLTVTERMWSKTFVAEMITTSTMYMIASLIFFDI